MKLKYILGLSAIAIAGCVLTSCNDDDNYDFVGNPNNLVYVNIAREYPASMPKNTFAYTIYSTPIGSIIASVPTDMTYTVKSTKNAPADIKVNLAVDPTMAVEGYKSFPEGHGLVVTLEESFVTIPKGTNTSNAIAVNIDDTNANWELFSEGTYLLPIRIASVEGAIGSQEVPAAYVGIDVVTKPGMLDPDASLYSAKGTQITDKSGWTATYSVTATGVSGDCTRNLFDGRTNNYAYLVFNHQDSYNEEVVTTIDLGKVYNLSAVQFCYYGWYYYIKQGKIETSTDGTNFIDQGTISDIPQWSTTPCFNFFAPFAVRYVRLTGISYHGGTGEGQVLAEFNAFE